jgi:CHAT domain-containing protein/Tfp pilus assembly protein PilF
MIPLLRYRNYSRLQGARPDVHSTKGIVNSFICRAAEKLSVTKPTIIIRPPATTTIPDLCRAVPIQSCQGVGIYRHAVLCVIMTTTRLVRRPAAVVSHGRADSSGGWPDVGSECEALVQEGDDFLRAGDLDQAERAYRRAAEVDPQSAEALRSVAYVLLHRGDLDAALPFAQRAVTAQPTHTGARDTLGNVLMALGRHRDAIEHLTYAAAHMDGPAQVLAQGQVGLCYEALGEWAEAERWLRTALDEDPAYVSRNALFARYFHGPGVDGLASASADLHHALARVLQQEGNLDEARLHYHLTKRIDPTVELDPMYLQIMPREELENYPAERPPPGEFDSDEQRLEYLLGRPSYQALTEAAAEPGMSDLRDPVLATAVAAQRRGDYAEAARLWVVVQCLAGVGWAELYDLMAQGDGQRLMSLAQAAQAGSLPVARARDLAGQLDLRAGEAGALVDLSEVFLQLDMATGMVFAETTAAAAGSRGAEIRYLIGDALYRAGRLSEARGHLERAAGSQEASGDLDQARVSLALLSRLAEEQDRIADALTLRKRVIALAEQAGDRIGAAAESFNVALLLVKADDGVTAHQTASRLAESLRTDPEIREGLGPTMGGRIGDLITVTAKAAGAPPPSDLLAELAALTGPASSSDTQADADQARAYGSEGRWPEAAEAYDRALRKAATAPQHQDIWPLLVGRAMVAREMSDPSLATEMLERALSVAYGDTEGERENETLIMLSQQHLDDDPARALSIVNRVFSQLPDDAPLVRLALEALDGWSHGVYPTEQLRQMRDQLQVLPRQGAWSGYALVVAETAEQVGAALLAEEISRQVITYAQSKDVADLYAQMRGRMTLAGALLRKGEYEQARAELEQGIDLARAIYDLRSEIRAHQRLAEAFLALGYLDRSVVHRRHEAEGDDRFGDIEAAAVARVNLAHLLLQLGRTGEAIDEAENAIQGLLDSGRPDRARFMLLILDQHASPDDLPHRLQDRLVDLPYEVTAEPGSKQWLYEHLHLARRRLVLEGPAAAWRSLRPVLDYPLDDKDRGFAVSARLEIARALADADPAHASMVAQEAITLVGQYGTQPFVATQIREVLLDTALTLNHQHDIDALLTRLVEDWRYLRRTLGTEADRVAVADHAARYLYRAAHRQLDSDPARALMIWDAARSPTLAEEIAVEAPFPITSTGWAPLLSALGPTTTILSIGLIEDEMVVMVAGLDTPPRMHRPGLARTDVGRLVATFRREMHTFQGHGAQSWTRAARTLLAGVASDIPGDALVVAVVDPLLQELPLHAIALPDGRPLIEHAAVVYAPSLSVFDQLAARARSRRGHQLLVTVGVAFPDEARAISIRFGGPVLSGNRLDKQDVREQVASADLIHFACHGRYDPQLDMASGLLLTTSPDADLDEILSIRDLEEWHLDAALVAVSACESGLGSASPSDYLGLGRRLLGVGANAVISALWKIDDAATQALMLRFYHELIGGPRGQDQHLDIASALRRAQLAEMGQRPLHQWAGFKLTGWPSPQWKEPRA